MQSFIYHPSSQRILFGTGEFENLSAEAERLEINRGLVITSPGRSGLAQQAAIFLGDRYAASSETATANVPASAVEAAGADITAAKADGIVVAGGGSAIGLGKALAAQTKLPMIAVVTTYSGSEMAAGWTIDGDDGRRQGRDVAALPKTVIYDPKLTLELPPAVSAASGMNAIAHAVESLYGDSANPIADIMATEAIRLLGSGLPAIIKDPTGIEARGDALYAAWLAANFRGGRGIEHPLAQMLRYEFDLNHAEAHAAVLPYAVAFNRDAAPGAMARICQALGSEDAALGLYELNITLGLKTGLREFGLPANDLDQTADNLTEKSFYNPRPVGRDDIRALLQVMYEGAPPHPR